MDKSTQVSLYQSVKVPLFPLMIDNVLTHLGKVVGYKELCQCRLVCSKWQDTMTSAFNRRSKLVILYTNFNKIHKLMTKSYTNATLYPWLPETIQFIDPEAVEYFKDTLFFFTNKEYKDHIKHLIIGAGKMAGSDIGSYFRRRNLIDQQEDCFDLDHSVVEEDIAYEENPSYGNEKDLAEFLDFTGLEKLPSDFQNNFNLELNLRDLIQTCSNLEAITLDSTNSDEWVMQNPNWFPKETFFPKLKSFTLMTYDLKSRCSVGVRIAELLKFLNIKHLSLKMENSFVAKKHDILYLYIHLNQMAQRKIEFLDLRGHTFDPETLKYLANGASQNFRHLRTLRLGNIFVDTNWSQQKFDDCFILIAHILKETKNTLEEFSVENDCLKYFGGCQNWWEYRFWKLEELPSLPKLKTLEIQKISSWNVKINYLAKLPNLQRLVLQKYINQEKNSYLEEKPSEEYACLSETLLGCQINANETLIQLRRDNVPYEVALDFPNEKILEFILGKKLYFDHTVLRIVYLFPNLRKLFLVAGERNNFSEIFRNCSKLDNLRDLGMYLLKKLDREDMKTFIKSAYRFKQLRRLLLIQETESTHPRYNADPYLKSYITFDTIRDGFCTFPKLEWLHLDGFPFDTIQAFTELKKFIRDVYLTNCVMGINMIPLRKRKGEINECGFLNSEIMF